MRIRDKFETKVNEVIDMSEKDRNTSIEEFKKSCICPTCPTYNDCARKKMEGLYCVLGKTSCETKDKGFKCPKYPLAQSLDVGIQNNTYCILVRDGSKREIIRN